MPDPVIVQCPWCNTSLDITDSGLTADQAAGTTYCGTEVGRWVNQCVPDSALPASDIDTRTTEGGRKVIP